MRDEIRIPLLFIGAYLTFRVLVYSFGMSNYYSDVFLPLIPFFALFNNYSLLVILFVLMGFVSSVVYYDEMFSNLLGYGISLMLLLNFSKKYSLINIFNYLISVFSVSIVVFIVQLLSYFAKDKVIVFPEIYHFVAMNLIAGIIYYSFYRIYIYRRTPENVKG